MIPAKAPEGAKSRLADLLTPQERSTFVREMLCDVLHALSEARGIERVLLITRDKGLRDLAGQFDATLVEDTATGLNAAFELARTLARADGAQRLLAIHGDLPALQARDIEPICDASTEVGHVVIAPDRARTGTNALSLDLDTGFTYRFGVDSFPAHQAEARRHGLESSVVERPGLALDIDTPADVIELLESGQATASRAVAFLESTGIASRLQTRALGGLVEGQA